MVGFFFFLLKSNGSDKPLKYALKEKHLIPVYFSKNYFQLFKGLILDDIDPYGPKPPDPVPDHQIPDLDPYYDPDSQILSQTTRSRPRPQIPAPRTNFGTPR